MSSATPNILCVNPFIHDFAAFDFWAKPLGLLQIAAVLRKHRINVNYIDCLDRFHPKENKEQKIAWDGRGPYRKIEIDSPEGVKDISKRYSRYGIMLKWFRQDLERLKELKKIDLIFVTSLMTYWAPGVKETISIIKEIFPSVPVVLGGIYATLCTEHAKEHSMADFVVSGSGFIRLNKIVKEYTGFDMGFEYKINDPSCFENLPYPALDMQHKIAYTPILTSIGCPLSCDYCASSYLAPKFIRRSPESVFNEIEHWYYKYKVKNFAFYDDALLVNGEKYAYSLFEKIIDSDMEPMFHTPNALHVKEITEKASELLFKAGFKTIRLGLETIDFKDRQFDKKVKEDEFYQAVKNLKSAGFNSSQIGAYLLCGLPGQGLDNVEVSFLKVKECGIRPTLAYYTPIPHTKMWEKAKECAKYDLEANPVFSNNTLFPCISGNPTKQIARMINL
ncbi:MAG: radical SAM protein [Desulfobacteraceae bacterium]|nr:radical SAM protein [Desulfobacteraceae bacterium]